jgi:hypothetical protein
VGRSSAAVAVRDTKDKMGPVLHFDPSAWHAFMEHLKEGYSGHPVEVQADDC